VAHINKSPLIKITRLLTVTAFFILSVFPVPGFAFNVSVTQGNATVSSNGNTITITATGKAILQGNTSIPSGVTVDVIQGLNDILLRDTTGSRTNILGSLLSNGDIILINAMGIYIGKSANVNVGGMIASTLDIQNQLFMSGTYQFEKIPGLNPAEILNEANINVANGGYLVLLADRVVNKGTITAYMGTIALGSGQQATVSFDQEGLVNLVIDTGLAQQLTNRSGKAKAQIINSGGLYANGGKIQMTAQMLETTLEKIVNNAGIIEAGNVVEHGGVVDLTASGAINNTGTIKAGTLTEQGETFHSTGTLDIGQGNFSNLDGAINISGDISGLYSDAGNIDLVGAVTLIGFTQLQADSGDTGTQGQIVMNGNSLTGGGNSLTLTAGVNDVLDGSITGVNLLTLNSSTSNNVTFTSTGPSFNVTTLQTNYNSLFSRSQGAGTLNDPYMIYSDSNIVGGLQYIPTESLSAYYQLANNINAAETTSWNAGAGFTPIGNSLTPFSGNFNGNKFTISNLTVFTLATDNVGLFGFTSGSTIENVGLLSANITGNNNVGGLVGNETGSILNSYVTGNVGGNKHAVGGLVGLDSGNIANSYAAANVAGSGIVGGLVGKIQSGSISNSYATGNVSGAGDDYGGLAGVNSGSITNSYAIGSVTVNAGSGPGGSQVGGLVGGNQGSISNSYAQGSVTGSGDGIGGLLGANSLSITNSYASGLVSGSGTHLGGLVGDESGGSYSNNFYDNTVNSLLTGTGNNGNVSGITGASTANMQTGSIFISAGWDFNGLWNSGAGVAYNSLVWQRMNNGSFIGGTVAIPFLVSNVNQLQFINYQPSASFQLVSDIVATATSGWNSAAGFVPIGSTTAYSGTFNGNGYTISNLFINLPATSDVGLFGQTSGATIEHVGLTNVNITGSDEVGGLVGNNNSSPITDSYVTGNVTGGSFVGGFVGENSSSNITNSYATATISGGDNVGGFIGVNVSSSITNSYASGSLTSSGGDTGGFAGVNDLGGITNSYASVTINGGGGDDVGGLIGLNEGSISNSFASGNVSGSGAEIGGFVGGNSSNISNSYATGSVSAPAGSAVGGFVGANSSSITNSYSTGLVSGSTAVGGFVGADSGGTYSANFYDDTVNSLLTGTGNNGNVSGITGASTANMQTGSIFISAGWDFNGLWTSGAGIAYNSLVWQGMNNGSFIGGTVINPFLVSNVNQLQFINYQPSASFQLVSDIVATATSGWNSAAGFVPIGNSTTPFSGTFNGNGYIISNLFIDLPTTDNVGLFGYTTGATIENAGLLNTTITGQNNVGSLVGNNQSSSIAKSYATGSVSGSSNQVGGLVGENNSSSIANSYAAVIVSGGTSVGGLVGDNNSSSITNTYATGNVSAGTDAGGLVGTNENSGIITNSFAVGSVSGSSNLGGLVGTNSSSAIANSYYTDTNHQNGLGTYDSNGPSDFFNASNPVYTGSTPWDFANTWLATGIMYPLLQISFDVWTGSGNWSNAANWSMGASPTSGTNVLFNATSLSNSTVDAFGGNMGDLLIMPGYTGTIAQNNALTLSGYYLQNGGTFNQNTGLSIGGSFTNTGGTFTAGSQPVTFTGSGAISGGAFDNLTVNASGTYTLASALTVGGVLDIESGTLNANGQTDVVTGLTTISGGTYNASTATQTFNGGLTVSGGAFTGLSGDADVNGNVVLSSGTLTAPSGNFDVSGSWTDSGGIFNAGIQTVIFTGAGSITGGAFDNLTVNASGTYTLTNALTVAGALNIESGVLDANGQTVAVTGLATISGTGIYGGSIATQSFGGLTISGGTFDADTGDVDVNGDVTLSSGSLILSPVHLGNLYVSGNWMNSGGVFTANISDVILSGTNQQISGNNTFYDLTKLNGGLDTLVFASGDTQVVTNQLDLSGVDALHQLSLRSSSSPGTWLLNLGETVNLSYLNVKDSQASGTLASCRVGCTDSGNNTGWFFGSTPLTPLSSSGFSLGVPSGQDVILQGLNAATITIDGQTGVPGVGTYWIPYGENWKNIKNDSKFNIWVADHAVQEPEDVELLPSSDSQI